jgi:hypothetical protein
MPHHRIRQRLVELAVALFAVSAAACSSPTGPATNPSTASPSTSPASPTATRSVGTPPAHSVTPRPTRSDTAAPSATGSAAASDQPGLAGLPLYPFTTLAEAREWEKAFESGGHQPWHIDAASTAQSFTQGYLGYAGIDLVLSTVVRGRDAKVTVGYLDPNGGKVSAAVLNLMRMGPDRDAPWEVVGSEDTTLTVTSPRYGSTITSPVRVSGLITGVDESVSVQMHGYPYETPLGQARTAAGGLRAPWSVSLPFSAPRGLVVTIAAAAGGHTATVERFAVTGAITR